MCLPARLHCFWERSGPSPGHPGKLLSCTSASLMDRRDSEAQLLYGSSMGRGGEHGAQTCPLPCQPTLALGMQPVPLPPARSWHWASLLNLYFSYRSCRRHARLSPGHTTSLWMTRRQKEVGDKDHTEVWACRWAGSARRRWWWCQKLLHVEQSSPLEA